MHCQGFIVLVIQTDLLSNGVHCIIKTLVKGLFLPGTILPRGPWGLIRVCVVQTSVRSQISMAGGRRVVES